MKTESWGPSVAASVAEMELEIRMDSPPERVWKALVDETPKWWRKELYTMEQAQGFVIEARVGGRVYEHGRGNAGLLWFTVVGVQPFASLDLVGHLTRAYGGPAMTMIRIELGRDGPGGTVLRLTESLVGRVTEETLATMRAGWEQILADGLKPYVEGRAAPLG